MDSLFGFLVIIGIIVSAINKAAKQKSGSQTGSHPAGRANPDMPWQRMLGDVIKSIETPGASPASKTTKTQGSGSNKPGQTGTFKTQSGEGYGSMETASEYTYGKAGLGSGEGTGLGQTYAEMQPSSNIGSTFFPPSGSILESSSEGKSLDAMSASPGSIVRNLERSAAIPGAAPAAPQKAALSGRSLSFNKDSLVQAVIMSEILTRPRDRIRRWNTH